MLSDPVLTEKGVFPYEYIDGLDKLKETKLPPIKKFYSSLKNKHIAKTDYARAQKLWDKLGCKNLSDYCLVI